MHRSSCPEVSIKKEFLEISQDSQENTCSRVSFLRPVLCFISLMFRFQNV